MKYWWEEEFETDYLDNPTPDEVQEAWERSMDRWQAMRVIIMTDDEEDEGNEEV